MPLVRVVKKTGLCGKELKYLNFSLTTTVAQSLAYEELPNHRLLVENPSMANQNSFSYS